MRPRASLALACLLLPACMNRPEPRARPAGEGPAVLLPRDVARPGSRARGSGAAPGDEKGPGRFVSRAEQRTFYAATGGQLWYYLNLYYWAPRGIDLENLWIEEEVVAEFRDLRRWPDGTPAPAPPPKVTREYWAVGATGRTVRLDNHKDFWRLAENWCAGAVEVRMTLRLGRLRVRDASGRLVRPSTTYVAEARTYRNPKIRDPAEGAAFEPLQDEPTTVWGYRIPWSSFPAPFLRSHWEGLAMPSVEWRRTEAPVGRAGAPEITPAVR